jgi:hypothetical protein
MLGTHGVATSGGDSIRMCALYQGSEEENGKQSKCYDEGGRMWA